jgi:hypothetical protein
LLSEGDNSIHMGVAEDLIISIKFGKKENLAITYFKANKR